MARHFSGEAGQGRSRRGLVVGVVVLLAVCVAVGAYLVLSGGAQGKGPSEGSSEREPTVSEPAAEPTADLPFSVEGAPLDASLVEASEVAQTAELAGEWTFGGDYALIGSFPIDAQTVFGSATDSPDDVTSYRAALIRPDGATYLEDAQTEEPFFEPQDGTGSGERIVCRSSEISFLPASGLDNWRLQTWDKASGETTVLGSAELLNGTADTPAVGGDVVPVCNESHAFFSSCVSEGDGWGPAVVAFDLSKADQTGEVIGTGNYPAAVEGGALWASDQLEAGGGTLYGALSRWDGSSSSEVLTVSSNDGSWGISGVWAAGGHVAVCLSSEAADSGCYVVVWSEDLSHCEALIHAPSPSVVGSMNERWLVWGAGSQAENAEMYALEISSGAVLCLGSTPGYSRPCVAAEGDVMLVPRDNDSGPVVFSVGELKV